MAEQLTPKGRTLLGVSHKVSSLPSIQGNSSAFLSLPGVSYGHGLEMSSMEVLQGWSSISISGSASVLW